MSKKERRTKIQKNVSKNKLRFFITISTGAAFGVLMNVHVDILLNGLSGAVAQLEER